MTVFCDASPATCEDARSLGGVLVSGGGGTTLCRCGELELVARLSTEAALTVLSAAAFTLLWSQQFLKFQGYSTRVDLVEDSKSTVSVTQGGRSTSDRTS